LQATTYLRDPQAVPIGVAVVGCGYWGANYLRVLSELPNVRVKLACDTNPVRLKSVGERFRFVEQTRHLDDVLESSLIDAVVVATPAATHYEIAEQSLQAGKHVLVEKPLTIRAQESEALVALAAELNLTLTVGHTFLYNPGIQALKRHIDEGDLGILYYMYSRRTNLGPIRRDVNALWDLAPHDISIFNYLLGVPPAWASAVGRNVLHHGQEDYGFVSVGYESGVVAHIHVSWADPNKVREVVVVGSNQRIVFDDTRLSEQLRVYEKGVTPNPTEVSSYGEFQFSIRDGDIISPKLEMSEPLKNQCRDFIESMTSGRPPISDGHVGLEVVRVMQAIEESLAHDGAPAAITAADPGSGG
jgi:predicted dehydrogenase